MSRAQKLIAGDDGLPAEEVGEWAKEKHRCLCTYLDISRSARKMFLGDGKAGAVYMDLFCATGRSRIKGTNEWIDGSAVAAWKKSVAGDSAFSKVYISDVHLESLEACKTRLEKIGAPVQAIHKNAVDAAKQIAEEINQYGLNVVFVDPYSLAALDFQIIETLASLKRMDFLLHISAMDLQRNLKISLKSENSDLDFFIPGWRDQVSISNVQLETRANILNYWSRKVSSLGTLPSTEFRLITGSREQPLYWLALVAKHELAHKFWNDVANPEKQGKLFD